MSPPRPDGQCPTSVKVELVLRLLGGETLTSLSRQTGRPRKQLSVWRSRFLTGGEVYLDARPNHRELEMLRDARHELSEKVSELAAENRMLAHRAEQIRDDRSRRGSHPFCSEAYARALEEPGVQPLRVPEWGTYVLIREGGGGMRQAIGIRPIASLDPASELPAGLRTLRRAGVASVSLVTDPLWCPELPVLQQTFTACHPFRESYFVDRAADRVQIHKRHRNRINQARRVGEIREVSLLEELERWLELYQQNVTGRQIPQPFTPVYYERIAQLEGLRVIAVLVDDEIVTITIWVQHGDILYFLDSASSATGLAVSASYVAFAHVVENVTDCRYVFFGGSADFHDDHLDGLARFKRGFSNSTAFSYLCSATLNSRGRPSSAS